MNKVEFDRKYAQLLEINPEIALKTGQSLWAQHQSDPMQFRHKTGFNPSMVFKYELSNGYCVYISFAGFKDANIFPDGTIGVTGHVFNRMRGSKLVDPKFGIIKNLVDCGSGSDCCTKSDPFAAEFCSAHNKYVDICDIVKFAKESMHFREIEKRHIVLIEDSMS